MFNPTLKNHSFFLLLLTVLLLATSSAFAQDKIPPVGEANVSVTTSATSDRVRFSAPSAVVQLRLEVYDGVGQKLIDTEQRGGNVLDWHLQGSNGERVADGTYLCVVTIKSLSGRLSQKLGSITVTAQSAALRPASVSELSPQQAQAVGPIENGEEGLTVVPAGDAQPITVLANNAGEAQLARTRGALTFRVGDFFSGMDQEQMRLTEDGRLGIGTSNPRSTLDVAGTIRAERFLVAKPNTSVGDIKAQAPDAVDSVQPLIAGTGTQDRIAKWTDNSGTLGDSVVTETAGFVGIGTTTPTQALEVANGRIVTTGNQTLAAAGGILEIGTTLTNNDNAASGIRMRNTFNGNASLQQALDVAPTFAPSASISLARGFISTAFFAPPAGVTITDAYGGNANTVYNNTGGAVTNGAGFAIRTPIVFGALKPTTQYGLRISNQGIGGTTNSYGLYVDAQSGSLNNYSAIFAGGKVGIGTSTPNSLLDVAGDINVSGNAVIGGNIAAKYQDIAEWVQARTPIAANTVVILDTTLANAVAPSVRAYDDRVAGVVSAQPGVILGQNGAGKVLVATTGRVKVRVDATRHPIKIGDLLVTSDKPGVAMKSLPIRLRGVLIHRPGTIIGKALEPLASGQGSILVLLGLQ